MHSYTLPWSDPLPLARALYQQSGDMVFLFSGMDTGFSGRYSYLGYDVSRSVMSDHFDPFEAVLSDDTSPFDNSWFGYLGYELRHDIERLTASSPSAMTLPSLWMVQCDHLMVFDHHQKICTLHSKRPTPRIPASLTTPIPHHVRVSTLSSNMTKASYLEKVNRTLEAIHCGDLYQANITRKFYGVLEPAFNAFEVFHELCTISPSPYSAFMRLGETHIISSSPEQFIALDTNGFAQTRPIKGSAPRFENPADDLQSRDTLKASDKDKMENLMIVDLMRNDLAKSAIPGSVNVHSLFDVTPYATIYHMSSSISATKKPGTSSLQLIKQCFPPGSMTGAPKIKAMELCNALEGQARGIYSGAIGWFGGDGSLDLSVVIRTLIIQGNQFEFQVGGAIVADSAPIAEWQETITKSKALAHVLNLQIDKDLLF